MLIVIASRIPPRPLEAWRRAAQFLGGSQRSVPRFFGSLWLVFGVPMSSLGYFESMLEETWALGLSWDRPGGSMYKSRVESWGHEGVLGLEQTSGPGRWEG